MTFDELLEFIERRMSMSHIYQPLLIRSLLDADGSATLRQLALALLTASEPSIREAEDTIRGIPVRVLRKHGVIDYDATSRLMTLRVEKLTYQEKARLRAACERKLGEFLEKRGLGVWDYRLIDAAAVPHSVRFQVLADSNRRCALCGASEKERPLHVDHILPRSRGGTNERTNLQVLCARCNTAKGNRDTRDFRRQLVEQRDAACPFCDAALEERVVEAHNVVVAIRDADPVTELHTLIVPRRHTADFLSMTEQERGEANDLIRVLSEEIRRDDASVVGFNIGANCGTAAGQTIMHAHIHLIPRREGDTPSPAGGVRGVVPERMAPE